MRGGVGFETKLKHYLISTGTRTNWLAEQIGVSSSTISRWANGQEAMAVKHREAVLRVLKARAEIPLDNLLDDQIDSLPVGGRARVKGKFATREAQLEDMQRRGVDRG